MYLAKLFKDFKCVFSIIHRRVFAFNAFHFHLNGFSIDFGWILGNFVYFVANQFYMGLNTTLNLGNLSDLFRRSNRNANPYLC